MATTLNILPNVTDEHKVPQVLELATNLDDGVKAAFAFLTYCYGLIRATSVVIMINPIRDAGSASRTSNGRSGVVQQTPVTLIILNLGQI